jgi:hypothetical protein
MLPMSWPTTSARLTLSASSTPAMSSAWFFFVNPLVEFAESPIPRRSGTITVWLRASVVASGTHMSPVSP